MKNKGRQKATLFGTVSQPLIRQPDLNENLQLPILVESWKIKFLLPGHHKLGKKLPSLQIHSFNQSFLLFLTMSVSLSSCNEKGYIKKYLSSFPRIHGSQTLLSHGLTKNCDINYSLYEGEVDLTPPFDRSSRRRLSGPKEKVRLRTMQAIPTLPWC